MERRKNDGVDEFLFLSRPQDIQDTGSYEEAGMEQHSRSLTDEARSMHTGQDLSAQEVDR